MIDVAVIGDGQLARGVASRLSTRADVRVHGPAGRELIPVTVSSGADVVVIATTTRLSDVAGHIEEAVRAGSNVLVSAEECAYPWAVDAALANRLDGLAQENGVTILGCGLNPGFVFDALVLTLIGAGELPTSISVERTVDVSAFGAAVRARLGVAVTETEFAQGIQEGSILGHAGFPQSMAIVADALGVVIDSITTSIRPTVENGLTVGFVQEYVALVAGVAWFRALFVGHLRPATAGLSPRDVIEIMSDGAPVRCTVDPGIGSQSGSQALIANSIDRVVSAAPGWRTVAELEAAHPRTANPNPPRTPIR